MLTKAEGMTQRCIPCNDSLRTVREEVQTSTETDFQCPCVPPKLNFEMQDVFTVHKTGSGQARLLRRE